MRDSDPSGQGGTVTQRHSLHASGLKKPPGALNVDRQDPLEGTDAGRMPPELALKLRKHVLVGPQ